MVQVEPWGLDVWQGWVRADVEGDWTFRVEAWSDPWATWLHNAQAKLPIAQDVPLVCLEVQRVLERGEALMDAIHFKNKSLTSKIMVFGFDGFQRANIRRIDVLGVQFIVLAGVFLHQRGQIQRRPIREPDLDGLPHVVLPVTPVDAG